LILEWSGGAKIGKPSTQIKMPLTHEEIAEFIGTTCETVTRTFSEFKKRKLVAFQGSTLLIANREALNGITDA
jgi:CRP/FNR family transcriptional regulator